DARALAAVRDTCSRWQVPDTGLDIELTESALIDYSDDLVDMLEQLSAANITIALDDFGCGYSSLSLLSRLPVRHLKIDRSFTSQLGLNPRAQPIVEAIIRLGQTLGMEIVAEGIETREQLLELQLLGCHIGQGFLFSRAVGRDQLMKLLPAVN